MKRLLVVLAFLAGIGLSALGQEQKGKLTTCPLGWTAGPNADWKIFWNDALTEARQSGKKIFALSTGSDWCGWCKKLKKDVLTTEAFNDFAKKNLVLLYLDSPRKALSEAQALHNRTICRELRFGGGVPCAAVFAADARRLGVLSGGGYTASNYVERLEKILSEKGELPKSGQPSKIFTEGYVEPPKEAVKWKYEIVGDGVVLGRGGKGFGPAVEGDAFGALVIPEKIDGKPVRVIGNSAFYGRSGLTSVTIPGSVTNIGRSAFYNCSGLKSLTIPSGVTSIGGFAFFGCDGLTSITLPKRMTRIGEFAFRSCSGLSSMTIPDGVTHIESATFLFCTGLKSVTIPASVESIRPGAFAHCDSLSAFTVDGSNPAFCSKNGMICSKDGRKLVVGVNGDVEIPDGVALVKCCAFDDLAGLKSVKMPSSVENVEEDAFMGCSGLVSFSIDSSNASFSTRNGLLCSKDGKTVVVGVNGEVKIPNGVTTIKDRAFHDFAGVKSIEIPESVTRVGRYAFDGCEALADADGFVIVKGILFGYFGKASSVEIPENVRIIGSGAFTWRCGFKSVTIPSSVTNIEGSAFYCSKGLESLAIPSSVTQIEHGAFEYCTGLKTVILPSSVTSIRGYAFEGCTSLVDVDLQGSGVKVEARAFPEQIRSKLPDMSNPIGPIHVVVVKDEGKTGNKGSVTSQETKNAPVSESWQKGPSNAWFVKWDDAVAESKKTKKPIFVLSTGSDWCGWCIRLRKNVLSKPEFEAFAKKNLVLLYLDSPSKTPLCAEQKKHNQEVSRKLTLGGGVPNASVITADGEKLGEISGGGLELDAYLQKLGEIIGNAGVTAVAVEAKVQKTAAAKQEKPDESIIKNYKLCYADSGEVASMLNQMFKDCAALGDERMGIVSVKMKPDALRGVEEFIESLDIRLMELKLGVKVLRVMDVENIDAAVAKLKAEPDDVDVAFAQNVGVRDNCDFSVAGLFTMCGKSTAIKFNGHTRWNYNGGRASVNWRVVCSNESGMACALAGVQVVDGGNSATLGGCMVEERSGLFSFLCPSGINTAYLFQLTVEDANQDQSAVKETPDIRKSGKGNLRIKQEEEGLLDKANQDELEEKILDEKSQEELKKLATQIRKEKLAAAEKCIKAVEREMSAASKTNQLQRYSWKYEIRNGAVEIHGVTPTPIGDFEIPETIEGRPVVSVYGMRNGQMSSIKFPSTIKRIGDCAFENCRHLRSLEFPGSLERIGDDAFARCERLERVKVPPSVNHLAGNSFCESKKICSFFVDPENPNYRVENGMLLERDTKLVTGFPMMIAGHVRIPDGIGEIGNEAFAYCDRMTNVSIASSVKTIARQAFLRCDALTDVSVPEGVENLGSRAFSCCKRLQSLGLPASLTNCEGNPVQTCPSFKTIRLAAGNGAFTLRDGCLITKSGVLVCMATAHEQKELRMPQGIAEIGDGVFWDCNNLEVAVVPEGVVRIGGTAFHGCDRLRELALPVSLRQIGNLAFQFCPELKSVNVPAGVTNIASQAFAYNRKLEEVAVVGNCAIGWWAFADCPNLSSVRLLGDSLRLTDRSMPKELAQGVLRFPQGQHSAVFKGPIVLKRAQPNMGR